MKEDILRRKILYYFDAKTCIHIKLKDNKFLNGVVEEIRGDFFILLENIKGNYPVFFEEVEDVSVFIEGGKKSDEGWI